METIYTAFYGTRGTPRLGWWLYGSNSKKGRAWPLWKTSICDSDDKLWLALSEPLNMSIPIIFGEDIKIERPYHDKNNCINCKI